MRVRALRGARTLGAGLAALLFAGTVVVSQAGTSAADTAPAAGTPATVAADALPTVQIDGVAWTQTVVGNTVYVGGKFTTARPAGAAPGTSTTPRGNLLAYDIRTGNLITSFAPNLNGQVRGMTASPDGSRLYVAGEFTQADGVNRYRIAAYNTATGQLVSTFAPSLDFRATSVVATATTVYVGGAFNASGSNTRSRLAAFSATNGALLGWAPSADAQVLAMVLTPDKSKIIVGGQFASLNGTTAYGLGALDPVSGAVLPWAANQVVQNSGSSAAINSLSTDGSNVYGTGYVFGPGGNLEGTFAANGSDGSIVWIEDCHGDTYSSYSTGSAVYTVSHAHYCGNVGGFPQTDPWTFNRGLAWSANATGTVQHDTKGYFDWFGKPAPSLLTWFPQLDAGSFTGQTQAAWSVTGNADYVVMGGEFPRVNGAAQQGLVRFATRAIAPNKQGPTVKGNQFVPTLAALSAGTVRVTWPANWDRDNETLSYKVIRDGNTAAPVYETSAPSTFWNRPNLGFFDRGLTPGRSYGYRLSVTDALGNVVLGDTVKITATAGGTSGAYSQGVLADGASSYWRLGEASGTTAYDYSRFDDLTLGAGVTRGETGAVGDADTASTFDGSGTASGSTPSAVPAPDTFTAETWIKTTTTAGGKVLGFGDRQTGTSSNYDRQIYMDGSGRLVFGVYDNGTRTVASAGTFNDGAWHHVVASLGSAGMTLYVDAKRVGRDAGVTRGQPFSGYWRVGGDNLGSWPAQPSSNFFNGAIDDVAIYPTALSLDQVQTHYTSSGRTVSTGVKPTDAYGAAVFTSAPESYWRLEETGGPVAADTTPNGSDGIYSGGVTYGSGGAVPGTGRAVDLNGADGAVAASNAVNGPTVYSQELWFKTTTTQGGKLIGFGSSQIGSSGGYDRHVYMFDDGRLRFGTYTGQLNVIDSDRSYNDGAWHHLVALQGPQGMDMLVDGSSVGTNPQTQAQAYGGYWRVGGDNTWGGASSNYFRGTIDEVAIYDRTLTGGEVLDHFRKGGGTPANVPPTAAFTSSVAGLTASFDALGSSDADGSVASYSWDFGDGTTGAGASPQHVYAAAGTFSARVTVTDDKGATASVSHDVTVTAPPANTSPTAAFTSTVSGLTASFDASGSSDADGSVASYAWDFGDGTTGAGVSPQHVYGRSGTFPAVVTVTDDKGATGSVSHDVTVTAPPANTPPTAAFTSTVSGLTASFDASGSSDADGSVASYAWNFGDGTLGSGKATSRLYATPGTYTVTLTVTDDKGATGQVARQVTVTAPAGARFALDAFSRTVTGGFGTADTGGAWTAVGGASNLSVGGGVGRMRMTTAGASPAAYLNGTSSLDTDVRVAVALDTVQTGGGTYVSVIGRKVGTAGDYRYKLRYLAGGAVSASISRIVGTTETTLSQVTVPGLTYAPGEVLQVRMQVSGSSPTTVTGKVWRQGQTEPAAWLLTSTDSSSALQAPGSLGLLSYLSGSSSPGMTASFDDFSAGPRQ